MKVECKKCFVIFEVPNPTWKDIERLQQMTCGGGGTHRVRGIA